MNGLREDRLRDDLADLAGLTKHADLHDRVVAASRRGRVRSVTVSGLAVIMVVAVGVGFVLYRGPTDGVGPSSTEPAVIPTGTLSYPNEVHSLGVDGGVLADKTLNVPDWPGASQCDSGPLTFIKEGVAGDGDSSGPVSIALVKEADVNGDGALDQVAVLWCAIGTGSETRRRFQVVAFSDVDSPSGARTIGRVTGTGLDGIIGVFAVETKPDGTIRVQVGDEELESDVAAFAPLIQWREYHWQETAFAQTGGETSFPTNPPSVELVLTGTVAQSTIDGEPYVTATLTVTNQGTLAPAGPLWLVIVVPDGLQPVDPSQWAGCLRDPEQNGSLSIVCPFAAGPGSGSYSFRRGQISEAQAPSISAVIVQGEQRHLERRTSDNFTSLDLP